MDEDNNEEGEWDGSSLTVVSTRLKTESLDDYTVYEKIRKSRSLQYVNGKKKPHPLSKSISSENLHTLEESSDSEEREGSDSEGEEDTGIRKRRNKKQVTDVEEDIQEIDNHIPKPLFRSVIKNQAKTTKLQFMGNICKYITEKVGKLSCCFRFFMFTTMVFLLMIYITSRTISERQKNLVPLAHHISTEKCFSISSSDPGLSKHMYLNRTIYNYVMSARYHIDNINVLGTTAYHVGVPLCFVIFRDRNGRKHTLYNPEIVGTSPDKFSHIKESDILCPEEEPYIAKRYNQITIVYDDISDDYLSGRSLSNAPNFKMRENMTGGNAYLLQHLIDTLEGRNVCNKKTLRP